MNDSSDSPQHLDKLGQLCNDGLDIARYLYQVPDEEGERERARAIIKAVLDQPGVRSRRELPKVAEEMLESLDGEATPMSAGLLQEGFERMIRLSQAAKSGLL